MSELSIQKQKIWLNLTNHSCGSTLCVFDDVAGWCSDDLSATSTLVVRASPRTHQPPFGVCLRQPTAISVSRLVQVLSRRTQVVL